MERENSVTWSRGLREGRNVQKSGGEMERRGKKRKKVESFSSFCQQVNSSERTQYLRQVEEETYES